MNNEVFGKTFKNVRKRRGIKFVITEGRRNYLVSETKFSNKVFFRKCISYRNRKHTNTQSINNIDKIYLYSKDPYEAKQQLLIKKSEGVGLKYCNDFQGFF